MKHIVYAVVVAYYPKIDEFLPLVDELVRQTDMVIVVDNTDARNDCVFGILSLREHYFEHINIIRLGKNFGIAAALNVGIDAAMAAGCTHVLLSDQDSLPDGGMVSGLLRAEAEVLAAGVKIGAVGPVYVDEITGVCFPFQVQEPGHFFYSRKQVNNETPNISTLSLITSGILIRAQVLQAVGSMIEDFFIDHVDVEWCHRAIAKGYQIIGTVYAKMRHKMGDRRLRFWYFGWHVTNGYGPIRLYYRFRNFVYLLRLSYVSRRWKIRASWYWLGIFYAHLFFAPNKLANLRAMLTGIQHGLVGRMGEKEMQ